MKKTGRSYVFKKNKSRRPFPKTRKHKNSKVKRTLKGGNPLLGHILAGVAALGMVGGIGYLLTPPDENATNPKRYRDELDERLTEELPRRFSPHNLL